MRSEYVIVVLVCAQSGTCTAFWRKLFFVVVVAEINVTICNFVLESSRERIYFFSVIVFTCLKANNFFVKVFITARNEVGAR